MAQGDEKASQIMIFRPPQSEFFPNHPNESKNGGQLFYEKAVFCEHGIHEGKRGSGETSSPGHIFLRPKKEVIRVVDNLV